MLRSRWVSERPGLLDSGGSEGWCSNGPEKWTCYRSCARREVCKGRFRAQGPSFGKGQTLGAGRGRTPRHRHGEETERKVGRKACAQSPNNFRKPEKIPPPSKQSSIRKKKGAAEKEKTLNKCHKKLTNTKSDYR